MYNLMYTKWFIKMNILWIKDNNIGHEKQVKVLLDELSKNNDLNIKLKDKVTQIKLNETIIFKNYKWTTLKEFNQRPQSTLTRKILKTII